MSLTNHAEKTSCGKKNLSQQTTSTKQNIIAQNKQNLVKFMHPHQCFRNMIIVYRNFSLLCECAISFMSSLLTTFLVLSYKTTTVHTFYNVIPV